VEYSRAATEDVHLDVWWEVVRVHPEMKAWVVHNKAVPIEIIEALSRDEDVAVRYFLSMKLKGTSGFRAECLEV
jgi:hypothetical protein